ncbi:DNA-binding CsgD family transcriptional regulator [Sedimentibacter acidaminivorans]|uniref:DNA-binding CsgD family transcriptional regulator n=1 Tax=Sedimentibacter acidaminivorans TaxID=913099 RepID=A0ABS4GAA6_9FIRM|nr:hypothetical protein [Sedimentibacter acidaminivorans]MBP1924623.1 DNA-binding CsgD family transcriptional regulator [Sedimentibacter acidaminivorans]
MERNCSTCAFDKGTKCKILKEKIPNCFAWADMQEAKKREKACREYIDAYVGGTVPPEKKLPEELKEKRNKNRDLYLKLRGGKTVTETLDERFNWLYLQGLSDKEIAKRLYVNHRAVTGYRNDKKLPPWKQNNDRSAGTETVESNKGLKEMLS